MPWNVSDDRIAALNRMTEALKVAKLAKDRGVDVNPLREILKQAQKAFMRGEYLTCMQLANQAIERCGATPSSPT